MQLEELRQRAKSQALPAEKNGERLQRDVRAFFSAIPEPPMYRRREDPAVKEAGRLMAVGEGLLARALQLPDVEPLRAALEAHLVALSLLIENKIEEAEPKWRDAVALERAATVGLRLWRRSGEGRGPVFDRASGVSRFDPQSEAVVHARLVCPQCRKEAEFGLPSLLATHRLACPRCQLYFVAYLGELRTVQTSLRGRTRHSIFRVVEPSGAQTRVEVDDATGTELPAAPRDLLAFLYAPPERLRGVLNLDTSRVLWLNTTGPCFVATAVFGEGAPQLVVLRRFRDDVLLERGWGRRFVGWYYANGPQLARLVAGRPWLRQMSRVILTRFVRGLEHR